MGEPPARTGQRMAVGPALCGLPAARGGARINRALLADHDAQRTPRDHFRSHARPADVTSRVGEPPARTGQRMAVEPALCGLPDADGGARINRALLSDHDAQGTPRNRGITNPFAIRSSTLVVLRIPSSLRSLRPLPGDAAGMPTRNASSKARRFCLTCRKRMISCRR
jgi:hypothetical protein